MVKITYTDPTDADAPKITWHGVVFRTMVPTEVDAIAKKELVEQARTHPYFTVEDPPAPTAIEPKAADPDELLPPLPKAKAR